MEEILWKLDNLVRFAIVPVNKKDHELQKQIERARDDIKTTAMMFITRFNDNIDSVLMNIHYHDNLFRIKRYMETESKKDPIFRSLHDRIFGKLLPLNANVMSTTRIFEELLKGITYFHGENDNNIQPIYHRLRSCGPRGDITFRTLYNQCKPDMKKSRRTKVKRLIERCYVERLIYHELYIHETLYFPQRGIEEHLQDKVHMNWLSETNNDFQTCFPNMSIQVTLSDFDGLMPKCLTIEKYKADQLITKETYYKEVIHGEMKQYEKYVICLLQTNHRSLKRKVQSFEKVKRWT